MCNDDGSIRPLPAGQTGGDCGDYVSKKNHTKWRLQAAGGQGGINKIFRLDNKGKAHRYVEFVGGSEISRIIYKSPEALKFAEKNGYRFDERNQTMVKVGSEQDSSPTSQSEPVTQNIPQATNAVDCASKLTLLEKMKCIADEAAAMKK